MTIAWEEHFKVQLLPKQRQKGKERGELMTQQSAKARDRLYLERTVSIADPYFDVFDVASALGF